MYWLPCDGLALAVANLSKKSCSVKLVHRSKPDDTRTFTDYLRLLIDTATTSHRSSHDLKTTKQLRLKKLNGRCYPNLRPPLLYRLNIFYNINILGTYIVVLNS